MLGGGGQGSGGHGYCRDGCLGSLLYGWGGGMYS